MRSGYSVEQVFIRPRGGQYSFTFVLVAPSGALLRDSITLHSSNLKQAISMASRYLFAKGFIDEVRGLRLRVERAGTLHDDANLKAQFIRAFETLVEPP